MAGLSEESDRSSSEAEFNS